MVISEPYLVSPSITYFTAYGPFSSRFALRRPFGALSRLRSVFGGASMPRQPRISAY